LGCTEGGSCTTHNIILTIAAKVSRGSDSTLNWRSIRVYTDVYNKPLGCSEGSTNPPV